MWLYITALFTALAISGQVTEGNSSYQDVRQDSVNETNYVNGNSVTSAVSGLKNSHSQMDENGVEIIKSVELHSSSADFLMNIPGSGMSWVDTPPVSIEHANENEKHVVNSALNGIEEFSYEDNEPFTASASEDAPASVSSDQTADKDFSDDFDFQSRILIGNLLLRENNETIYTSPQNINIKENDNLNTADIISSSQENDNKTSLKLTTRKRKKSRPFNHWDFGRRTKPPKNLTKEQVLFPKFPQPVIPIPFKNKEESNQYSFIPKFQDATMYTKNTPTSSSEEYFPFIQQHSLQSQQAPATNSEPYSVRNAQAYILTNEQQIPLRHSQPVGTNQQEENYYSRNTGYTPQLFFVARYVPGYKIISQPVLNTQEHHTTPPVYVSTPHGLQQYPLIISQSSQTEVPVHTTE